MSDTWKNMKIEELGSVVGGATPSTKIQAFYGGDIAWITPKDLSIFQGRYISCGERSITPEGLKSCSAQLMPADSVLFTSRAPIGYIAISKNELCTNQGFKSIVPNETVDPLFLYYLLVANREKIKSRGSGTTFKEVSGSVMKQIEVLVPRDKDTQKAIAGVLGALDMKIELNNQINHNLEQQAQALFQSWFVDLDPWDGVMPDGWKEVKLGDAATLSAGGDKPTVCSSTKTDKCSIPIFSNSTTEFGLYGFTNQPKIIEESVTVSARGTIGFVCLRQEPFVPIVRLITAIPNIKLITAKYLYLYLSSISIAGVGTTQQQLTVPDFKNYQILVPNYSVVEAFTSVTDPIFCSIKKNQAENNCLAKIRDSLLPKLMSGEIDVSSIEP